MISVAAIDSRWWIAAGWFLPVGVVVAGGFVRGARLLVSRACALRPRRCKTKFIYELRIEYLNRIRIADFKKNGSASGFVTDLE